MVMVQFARACAITASEFRWRCRIVSSILSSLLKTKDWEWAWQLHVRFLNRTAAPSRGKTPMVVGLNSNLSFRSPHHLHDACEKPHLFDQRRHIRSESRVEGYCARPVIRARHCGKDHLGARQSRMKKPGIVSVRSLGGVRLRSNMAASNASVVFTCFALSTPRSDLSSRRRSFRVERPQSASHVGRLAPRTIQRSRSVSKVCEASSTYGCHY